MGIRMRAKKPDHALSAPSVVTLGLGLCLLACAGCVTVSPEGISLLQSANADYNSNRWPQAESQAAQFIQKYQNTPVVAEAYYLRGMSRVQQKQYASAEADFQKALEYSKRKDLTAKVHAILGYVAMIQDKPSKAVVHYRQAIAGLDERPPKDEIYYRYATSLQRIGQWDEARICLARVVDGYPGGEYASLAKRKLAWAGRFFSIQCGLYSQMNNADTQVGQLRQSGLDARRSMMLVGGEPRYVVYVGRYPTYQQACVDLARVRVVVKDAIVVP
jgi:tetratricopeptide (TPR) repeat protein